MASSMLLRGEDYQCGLLRDEVSGQIPSAEREVYELVCVTEGGAEYWIEDQYYKLAAGDVLLMPVGTMVGANLKQRGCPFVRYSIWFSRRYMTFLKLQDGKADFSFAESLEASRFQLRLPEAVFEGLKEGFAAMAEECSAPSFNGELSAKAALSGLLVQVNRLANAKPHLLLPGDENRLSEVLTYIHGHCTEALTVEQLATMFGYSNSHLAHSFKRQMGTSIYHYVLLRRLQIGKEAMLEGVPVKEAYQRCGFGDYAGFYRSFMKEFGMSPQQYKKKNS